MGGGSADVLVEPAGYRRRRAPGSRHEAQAVAAADAVASERSSGTEGHGLAPEQGDPRVVDGVAAGGGGEALTPDLEPLLFGLGDESVELGAEPIVGHACAIALELVAGHHVVAAAGHQAVG